MAMVKLHRTPTGLIEKKVWIQASPGIIYQALTAGNELARWFCDRAQSDPRVGGEIRASWHAGAEWQRGRGVFTRLLPGSLVELHWVEDGELYGPDDRSEHRLSFRISPRQASCEVHMCDEDPRIPDEEAYAALDDGWNGVLRELKDYCERKQRSSRNRGVAMHHQGA